MIWGESGREKTQPNQGNQTPTLNGQRGVQRGRREGLGWTGEKNRVVGREGCFEVGDGVGGVVSMVPISSHLSSQGEMRGNQLENE